MRPRLTPAIPLRFRAAILLLAVTAGAHLPAADSRTNANGDAACYFPGAGSDDWERVDPADAGWDRAKLDAALEYAGATRASGVVVLHRGRILAERYWIPDEGARAGGKARSYGALVRGHDAAGHAVEDVASIQKSIAAMMIGIAQHKGLLALGDPVEKFLGKGWTRASPEQEAAITIRHLLTMTSGLTENLSFEAPAGTRWRYNSGAYGRVMPVVAAAAGKTPEAVTRDWLTGPIGMADSRWVEREGRRGEESLNPLGFATTARDLARFGLLVLARGRWNGTEVIADGDFLAAALTPSQELNPSYGYLWWLNGQDEVARGAGARVKGPLIPGAPPDLVAALGAVDRKLYVVPSLHLVVTRLGNSAPPAFQNEFWKRLMQAVPRLSSGGPGKRLGEQRGHRRPGEARRHHLPLTGDTAGGDGDTCKIFPPRYTLQGQTPHHRAQGAIGGASLLALKSMGKSYVIMGVSGSGKTTVGKALAEATGGKFFDGDDYHSRKNVEKMRSGIPLDDGDRRGWLEGLRNLVQKESARPEPVFLACSALKRSYRDILCEGNDGLRFIFLHGPEALLRERMQARKDHYMPPGLLTSQLDALEPPADAIAVDVSKPASAIIDELLSALGVENPARE